MITQQERLIFFELLRASLWERDTDLSVFNGSWKWSSIIQAFLNHKILGLVANVIMDLPSEYLPDEQQQLDLLQYSANLLQVHQNHNIAIKNTFARLEDAGCHPVLLKGQGIAALYPKNCIRNCGDIDIYVGPEEMEKAKLVMNAKATQDAIAKAQSTEMDHQYHIVIDDIIYEIHRYLGGAGNKFKRKQFMELSTIALKGDNTENICLNVFDETVKIKVPSGQVNSWFIFNHIIQHYHGAGIGLRQFCDWLMVLKNSTFFSEEIGVRSACLKPSETLNPSETSKRIDILKLSETLDLIGLTRAWKILSGILVYQLGFPADKMPLFDDKMAKKSQGFVLDHIIEGRKFHFGLMPDGHRDSNFLRRFCNSLTIYYKTSRTSFVISRSYPIRKFFEEVWKGAVKLCIEWTK